MYPGFFRWWKHAQAQAERDWAQHCGEHGWHGRHRHGHGRSEGYEASGADDLGPAFGVRRPLRFMAYKLELNESQVAELARILNDLKTERAQAAVDQQRTISSFADALQGDAFDRSKAEEGAKLRVDSADRLRAAVLRALERTHALLDPTQRQKLAYLLRSGALSI